MNNKKEVSRTDVNKLGEFGLIDHLTRDFPIRHKETILGIGDDAAILEFGEQYQLVSTDLLVEGIHFDMMYSPIKHLGYKSVVVNLSDIYAMNGTPRQITVSIAISNRYSVEALEELYAGIRLACDRYGVDLIGGDTTSSLKGMTISVTAIGTVDKNKVTKRSGAKAGDILCVTGDVGAAYLGLQILEREKQLFLNDENIKPNLDGGDYLIERQLKPEARREAVHYFAKNNIVPTAMIDVSDGLSSDLMHICKASDVGAFIEEGKVPLHPKTEAKALDFQLNPITTALNGGEDYELLFTINEKDLDKIRYMPGVYIIGEIVDKKDGITLHTTGNNIHPLQAQGWEHF